MNFELEMNQNAFQAASEPFALSTGWNIYSKTCKITKYTLQNQWENQKNQKKPNGLQKNLAKPLRKPKKTKKTKDFWEIRWTWSGQG